MAPYYQQDFNGGTATHVMCHDRKPTVLYLMSGERIEVCPLTVKEYALERIKEERFF